MIEKIKAYFNEAYDELVNKVSWPTWEELQSSTIVVLVASLIFAVVISALDLSVSSILGVFYSLFN